VPCISGRTNERLFSRVDALQRTDLMYNMHVDPNIRDTYEHSTTATLRLCKSNIAQPARAIANMPQTLYPRGTVKKIIKAHSARPLSKNVDILVRPYSRPHLLLFPC
jgi:hypothetical protein